MKLILQDSLSFIFVFLQAASFLLLLISPTTAKHSDILPEICRRCADTSPNVKYDACIGVLSSRPRSRSTNLRGLTVISFKLAISNATRTKHLLQQLLKSTPATQRYARSCVKSCVEIYEDAISSLKDSITAVKEGRYEDAKAYVSSAVDAPETCEDGFSDGGEVSPVSKENERFYQIAVIALGMTALLQD